MDFLKISENPKVDCLEFRGHIPCNPHKKYGVICSNCPYYQKSGKKILIIKLGAAGEVIRNTPILEKIKKVHPNSKIFWLTQYPELVPEKEVYKVCDFNNKELELLKDIEFDILYSLDKHEETGALANRISAKIKKGFSQRDGSIIPFDDLASKKWETGFRNDLMKKNENHYIEETFEICEFEFNGEKYVLPDYSSPEVDLNKNKRVVALNTGTGSVWKPRIYSDHRWIELAKKLISNNYEVFLVGGPEEDKKNKIISRESGAKYFGTFNRRDFMGLLDHSDIIVTSVTFGLHVGIGLGKKIVLLNNVFNGNEFHLYGNGVILEPNIPCKMCYKLDFDKNCYARNCMDLISPNQIFSEIEKLAS